MRPVQVVRRVGQVMLGLAPLLAGCLAGYVYPKVSYVPSVNVEAPPRAQVTRVILEGGPEQLRATGVEYVTADGATAVVQAAKEVVLSAGAVGSPHILLLSGIYFLIRTFLGPR